jgi:hypothetical protein
VIISGWRQAVVMPMTSATVTGWQASSVPSAPVTEAGGGGGGAGDGGTWRGMAGGGTWRGGLAGGGPAGGERGLAHGERGRSGTRQDHGRGRLEQGVVDHCRSLRVGVPQVHMSGRPIITHG